MKRINLFSLVITTTIIFGVLFQTPISAQEVKKTKKTKEIILISDDDDNDDLKTISFSVYDDELIGKDLVHYTLNNDFSDSAINALKEKLSEHGLDINVSKENGDVKICINSDTVNLSDESHMKVIKRIKTCRDDSVKKIKYIISGDKDCKEIIEEELIFEKGSWTAIAPDGGVKELIIKYCFDSMDNSGSLSEIIHKEIKILDIKSLAEGDSCLKILLKCDDDGKNIIKKIKIEMDKDCNEKTFHIYSSDEGEIKLDGDCKIIIFKNEDDCKSRVKILVNDEEAEKVGKDSKKEEKKKDKKKRKKTD